MNKYEVHGFGTTEVHEAHKALIMNNGSLKLVNQQGSLVKAWNKDAWDHIEKIDDQVTPSQEGTISEESE